MKRLLLVLIMFLAFTDVEAKNVIEKCTYKYSSGFGVGLDAEVYYYDNGKYEASIFIYNTPKYGDVLDDGITDYSNGAKSTPKVIGEIEGLCPKYLYLTYVGWPFKYIKSYVSDSANISKCTNDNQCVFAESSLNPISDIDIEIGNKWIKEAIDSFNNGQYATYLNDYDIESSNCKDDTIKPYADCITRIKNAFYTKEQSYNEVKAMQRGNVYWKDNADIAKLDLLYTEAKDSYDKLMTKLEAADAKASEEYREWWTSELNGSNKEKSIPEEKTNIPEEPEEEKDITTCEGYLGENVMNFVRLARNGIMIVGPILAVVLGTYEMAVGVAKGEDEDKKKALTRFKNRLIAAVLLLLTPYILEMILSFVNKSFGGCL